MSNTKYDSIIIGAGPAGLTAGIYLSRAKMKVLILDSGIAGGQMVLTHEGQTSQDLKVLVVICFL